MPSFGILFIVILNVVVSSSSRFSPDGTNYAHNNPHMQKVTRDKNRSIFINNLFKGNYVTYSPPAQLSRRTEEKNPFQPTPRHRQTDDKCDVCRCLMVP